MLLGQRCIVQSAKDTPELDTEEKKKKEKSLHPRLRKVSDDLSKNIDYVLDFFNNCDIVTLNRFLKFHTTRSNNFHKFIEVDNVIQKGAYTEGRTRFEDMKHFYDTTEIPEDKIAKLAQVILHFYRKESNQHQAGIPTIFYPTVFIPDQCVSMHFIE